MNDQAEHSRLLGIFTSQLGFIDSQQAEEIVKECAHDKSTSVASVLLERGVLTEIQLRSLESLVKSHLHQHGNNPAQSLKEIGALAPAALSFTKFNQAEQPADPLATVANSTATKAPIAEGSLSDARQEDAADPLATVAETPQPTSKSNVTAADPGATVAESRATIVDPDATVVQTRQPTSKSNVTATDPDATVAESRTTIVDPNATVAETRQPTTKPIGAPVPGGAAMIGPHSDIAAELGSLTSEGRRFRVVREHARGGLGQVYVAEDVELNREVALKELLSHCADQAESRYRFLREAEITGALEHPGIAPVYGLGQYADGRPYYAMRFIRGESLLDALARFHDPAAKLDPGRRSVELRRLLRNFVSVCEAIDYAHVRGVLHRDLKPANIMLGKHGETLVVDWGLATTADLADSKSDTAERPVKPVISGSMIGEVTTTLAGSALGTPAYMSPEQAEGALDQLGPATDIYGLGATLYHLLTGGPPFKDREVSIVLKKVREGDFPPPKSVDSQLPPQLNAICLKAMARRPEDRYATANLLAKDIEQWLADEPVSVWAEPFHVRTARWMRRHRTVVTSAVAALAVAIVAMVIGIVLLTAANERERQARNEAEHAYKTARAAVDKYYVQVSEEVLLNQPGVQSLRIELLRDALDYYDQFIEQHQDDLAVQDEFATTNFYVGQLREDIESPEAAIPSYTTAIEIQRKLLDQRSGDRLLMEALADSLNARGRARDRSGKHDDAFADFEEAAKLRGELVGLESSNEEFRRKQANTYMNLGLVEKKRSDLRNALTLYGKAQTIREEVLQKDPTLTKVRRDLAMGYYNQAVGEMMLKNWSDAGQYFENAITAFRQVIQENPQDLMTQFRLATSYRLRGDVNAAGSEFEAARRMYDESESRLEQLAYHNPDVPEFLAGLAGVLMNRGNFDAKTGGAELYESAKERFRKSIEILERLVTKDPKAESYRRDLDAVRAARARLQQ